MEMPTITGKVRYVNIDMADNGFIVRWDVQEKKPGASEFDHCSGVSKTHLFKMDQKDEAFDFFVALKKSEMGIVPEPEKEKEGF